MSENDPSWPNEGDSGGQSTPPPPSSSTPPPPPAASGATATGQSAGLGIRFGARLIDGILLGIVGFVIGLVLPDSLILSGIVSAILGLGYFVYLETEQGATFGKQMLNLKVTGAGGGNPTVEESLKRNGWLAFSIIPILGGFAQLAVAIAIAVTIGTNDDNRGIHDNFAGTAVPRTT